MTFPISRRARLSCGALALLTAGCTTRPPRPVTTTPPAAPGERGLPGESTVRMEIGALDPRQPLNEQQRRWVDSTLGALTLKQRIGQMTWAWMVGDYANVSDSSFAELRRAVLEDEVGGATMSLGSPIEVAVKINDLQRLARIPLLLSSDLEPNLGRMQGGVFDHYMMEGGGATVIPTNMAIGATGEPRYAFEAGRIIGREARAVGIHLNFAPTADVNNNPANPVINTRSFGEDPETVGELSAQFVNGSQSVGEAATAKHFPGHGDTDVDSHVGLPVVKSDMSRLKAVELLPFRRTIEAGVAGVMTAHIALPAISGDSAPATLVPSIITGLLRDSLRFQGLAITDALTMEGVGRGYTQEQSAVAAVKAGADILLKPADTRRAIAAVLAAVERGEITPQRIEASARRVLELKARLGITRERYVDLARLREVVGAPEHRKVAQEIAERALTLLRDRDNLVPFVNAGRTAVVMYAPPTELLAGRAFTSELRAAGIRGARAFRVGPSTSRAELDSIAATVRGMDRVIVNTYVRRVEGEGRTAIPQGIADWIDELSKREKVVVVAYGNPYVIRQFPSVGTYMVTYGVNAPVERAAARALTGQLSITGRAPITLPGFFQRGDGMRRDVAAREASR
jgi:beta-N-acetylhexosaminidase